MKTALITGANRGIGRETARQLAEKGFHVFIGARREPAAREVSDAMNAAGAKTSPLEIDVSDAASVETAVRQFERMSDHLDVLVNNAGICLDWDGDLMSTSDELVRKTMETNTLGPLRVSRAFIPLLKKSSSPRIINVSSGGGQLTGGADGWAPAYCISKTALNGVTAQLAAALPEFAVNSICPGWVRTDMGGAAAPRSVEQGADVIIWLATEAPQDLTGQFIKDRAPIPW